MNNVRFFTDELTNDVYAIINNEDSSQTSMLKSTYDEMIAQQEHLTENSTEDEE